VDEFDYVKEINITKSRSETIAVKTRKEANLTRQNKQHNNRHLLKKDQKLEKWTQLLLILAGRVRTTKE